MKNLKTALAVLLALLFTFLLLAVPLVDAHGLTQCYGHAGPQ